MMHRPFLAPVRPLLLASTLLLGACAGSGSDRNPPAASTGDGFASVAGPLAEPPRPLAEYDLPLVRSTLRQEALDMLEAAAFEDSPLLRANAIESLHVVPNRVEPIARAALTDSNPGVRFSALMTIGKLKLRSSRQFIGPLLSDRDPRVRMAAIYALHNLGEQVDQSPLAEYLRSNTNDVRAQAAYILGEIGNPSAIGLLLDTATPAPRSNTMVSGRPPAGERRRVDETLFRLQIAEALVKLGETRVAAGIHSALYPAARDDLEAAVLAAQILGELRDETAIRQLVELIEQATPESPETDDPRRKTFIQPIELRLAAATALAKMGETGGVYVADSALTSPDPAVRSQACFLYAAAALSRGRGTSGRASRRLDLAKLESLMQDPNPVVQVSAAAGLLRALEQR